MIPTPDLSHLTRKDYENVYEPAEDTFILLDALEADMDFIKAIEPRLCLEVGSGSGCVSAFLSKIIGSTEALYCCTDINPFAASATKRTGLQNKVTLETIQTSLASPFLQRCTNRVDIVVFNPPYVPTEEDEAVIGQTDESITAAWAGGSTGMTVTNLLLDSIDTLLSPLGCFYLVAVPQNKPQEIAKYLSENFGLDSKIVLSRRAGREHLHVLRFSKKESRANQ